MQAVESGFDSFPKTLTQAIIYFADPDRALDYLTKLRWPDAIPTCSQCGSQESSFISTRRMWKCRPCKKQYSVRIGTIMEDSAIPPGTWLAAIWMITSESGVSSYAIQRALGLTQKSGWFLLHRIRIALGAQQSAGKAMKPRSYYYGARGEHKKRFEEFARAVFVVPKREIDRVRSAYKLQKEKRRKEHARGSR